MVSGGGGQARGRHGGGEGRRWRLPFGKPAARVWAPMPIAAGPVSGCRWQVQLQAARPLPANSLGLSPLSSHDVIAIKTRHALNFYFIF